MQLTEPQSANQRYPTDRIPERKRDYPTPRGDGRITSTYGDKRGAYKAGGGYGGYGTYGQRSLPIPQISKEDILDRQVPAQLAQRLPLQSPRPPMKPKNWHTDAPDKDIKESFEDLQIEGPDYNEHDHPEDNPQYTAWNMHETVEQHFTPVAQTKQGTLTECRKCGTSFQSKNAMHRHRPNCKRSLSRLMIPNVGAPEIPQSSFPSTAPATDDTRVRVSSVPLRYNKGHLLRRRTTRRRMY